MKDTPAIVIEYLSKHNDKKLINLNLEYGFADLCFDKIAQAKDTHEARERIRKRQDDGSTIKDKMRKFRKFTTGNHVKAGTNHLGKCMLELMSNKYREKEQQQTAKLDAVKTDQQKVLNSCKEFIEKDKPQQNQTDKDLQIVLRALCHDKGEKTPKCKQEMLELHTQWKDREPLSIKDAVSKAAGSLIDGIDDGFHVFEMIYLLNLA